MTAELASYLDSRRASGKSAFWTTYLQLCDALRVPPATLDASLCEIFIPDAETREGPHWCALEQAAGGDREAFARHLTRVGSEYAQRGVDYAAWFRVVRHVRTAITARLVEQLAHDPGALADALEAMHAFFDWSLAVVGDAYRVAREDARRARDATRRALQRVEARFRRLFDSNVVGIIIGDGERVLEINEAFARMVGYRVEELLTSQEAWASLTPPQWQSVNALALRRLDEDGATRIMEKSYRHRDGHLVPVYFAASRVNEHEVIVLVLDISHQKQVEALRLRSLELEAENERVLEANRLKSEFLANMSHELRTPLHAILGISTLLHDGLVEPGSEDHQVFLADLVSSGEHLLQLINDVLDLSKVEAGRLDFFPERVDLAALSREVVSPLTRTAHATGVDIRLTVDPTLADVETDPSRFKQVLFNFVSNALKFTDAGGHVDVRVVAAPDDMFRVEVEDTGIGIAEEDLGRLFSEFEQLESGATSSEGTGLGLALTRHLVEAQGGQVGVESTLGEGSTFFALLPRVGRVGTARVGRPREEIHRHAAAQWSRPEVLVVDPDPQSRHLMIMAVDELGLQPVGCASIERALALCTTSRPWALVVDMIAPTARGLDFLDDLRALPDCREVPVIVWSAQPLTSEDRARLDDPWLEILPVGAGTSTRVIDALAPLIPRPTPWEPPRE